MIRRTAKIRSRLGFEQLEGREVPATLVSPTTMTYQDVDGDDVKVSFSTPFLTQANVNNVFRFTAGTVNGNNAVGQQLRTIDIQNVAPHGTSITVAATASAANGGDGLAAVGQVLAVNIYLGTVNVDGDLGRIVCGDLNPVRPALKSLVTHSIGKYGTSTGVPDLLSGVSGDIGSVTVKTDMKDAIFASLFGRINRINIGGSMTGQSLDDPCGFVAFNLGTVTIGGSVSGGVLGASSLLAEFDPINGHVVAVKVNGDFNCHVFASNTIGKVQVGGDFTGGYIGTDNGDLGSLQVDGDITAGTVVGGRDLGRVLVGGDIFGGGVIAGNNLGTVKVGGDFNSTIAASNKVGRVQVDGDFAGDLAGIKSLGTVQIGGSFKGGGTIGAPKGSIGGVRIAGDCEGTILSTGLCGPIAIGGNVDGGTAGAGRILGEQFQSIVIGGNLVGGANTLTGIITGTKANSVKIGGDVLGGSADQTGSISISQLGTLTVGGSLKGGTGHSTGFILGSNIRQLTINGDFIAGVTPGLVDCGSIRVGDSLGVVKIGRIIGNAANPARIYARGESYATGAKDMAIGSLTVVGDVEFAEIVAGQFVPDFADGPNADAQIGSVFVGGNWKASSLIAGVSAGADGMFGSEDAGEGKLTDGRDIATVKSKIGPVTIRGSVIASDNAGDSFGIMAEQVTSVKVGSTKIALKPDVSNDNVLVNAAGDLLIKEV